MSLLEQIDSPADLRRLDPTQLDTLAAEIRDFLIAKVSRTGGHLGPNLGMVELTLALHRAFDSPTDRLVFDIGHQAYVHKIVTGRRDGFDELRQSGGLSGYPNRSESEHDIVENSHASTALSYADGLAKAYKLRGEDRTVVAVIGDGALTGGMAWEALNNIAAAGAEGNRLVIVVNDNGRSYSPTVGGLATHLTSLRTDPRYEQVLDVVKRNLGRAPLVGSAMYEVLHGVKKGLKDVLAPQGMFEDLGLKYVGPVDGHDVTALEAALTKAKRFGGPVIVHAITRKGFGYDAAEADLQGEFHSHGAFDPATGAFLASSGRGWTSVFSDELVALGKQRPDLVAITAAMTYPTGLGPFAAAYPDRFFDVGIAEQHAVTSAAGLALGGLHPVVALYSTFLNRAFDQTVMDVALHRLGVTFVLDRAGVTGEDGPSHNGVWDCSILHVVPGLRLAAPRDGARLVELLDEAVEVDDGPTVLRFPKGLVFDDIEALEQVHGMDVLARTGAQEPGNPVDVLIVGLGAMAPVALDAAGRIAAQGYTATVVDPRWIKPVNPGLVELATAHRLVVTIEDSGRVGGSGAAIAQTLSDAGVDVGVRVFGVPAEFPTQGKRADVLARFGLTGQDVARDVVSSLTALNPLSAVAAGYPVSGATERR